MKKKLLALILVISSVNFAQDSSNVLFIGNSYTYGNDLPTMLTQLASSLGDYVSKDQSTPGGMTFSGHAGNSTTYQKINAKNWDFVVLQAQSQEPSFPDSQVNSQTLPYAVQIADSVYANSVCSQVLYFMTWGRENGDPQWAPISTFDGMNARLRSAYLRFADSTNASVSPVGSAWKYVRDNHPSIQLYTSDGSHPSVSGSYLAACTFYASIFRKSPVGATFISSLDLNTAEILQNAAAATVLHSDSIGLWNLRPSSALVSANFSFGVSGASVDFVNQSERATNYDWNFGNGNSSTDENPTTNFVNNGTYTVQLISSSPCGTDTTTQSIQITSADLENIAQKFGLYEIETGLFGFKELPQEAKLKVISSNGKVILLKSQVIDLRSEGNGIYLIQILIDNKSYFVKVLLS